MARIDPANVPLAAYSSDDITAMLEHARANLPEHDPWRRELEEFEAEEIRLGTSFASEAD